MPIDRPRRVGDVSRPHVPAAPAFPVLQHVDLSDAVRGLRVGRELTPEQIRLTRIRRSGIRGFAREYLKHHFSRSFCELHDDIFTFCDALITGNAGRRIARIAPRKFGKTTIISLVLPIFVLAYQLRQFVLMIGESSTMVEGNLSTLAQELETNHKLIEDFPHLTPAIDRRNQFVKWTDRQLVFRNWATVVAKGMGARMRGLKFRQNRPDLAIVDDPESPETADTFLKRRRHKRWFGGTFMGLGATDWDIVVIGNIPHHDCLIADLVKSKDWDGKLWRAVNIPRREKEPYPLGNTLTDGSALWPQEWPLTRLEAYKNEPNVGTLNFVREMMSDPREEENKHFDPMAFAYFDFTPDRLATYTDVRTFLDPAGGEKPNEIKKGKRDWACIVTAGRTADGFLDICDVKMTRKLPSGQINLMLDTYVEFGPRTIGIEENLYKNLIQPTALGIARRRQLYPTITVAPHTSNKISRILGIQPLIEVGVVRFARHLLDTVPEYFAQFDEFPGDFDDGPDATEGVVRMLEKGRSSSPRIISVTQTSYWKQPA